MRTPTLVGPRGNAEDERLAATLKAIRRRSKLTQESLADVAGVPVRDVIAIEAGGVRAVRLGRIRAVFEAIDGRARLVAWWHGAAADRLLDERHAGLVESALRVLKQRGWETAVEVSFSEFGERGSIDVLAGYGATLALMVGEVKSSIGSLEEMNRSLDVKVRLAPALATSRFGWQPRIVGRLLIFPEDRSIRRVIALHEATMTTVYPARSREVRAWLRAPDRPMRGVWFLSDLQDAKRVAAR